MVSAGLRACFHVLSNKVRADRAVEAKAMGICKAEIDRFLISMDIRGLWGIALRGKDRSVVIEWQSKLDGPNCLILLL